MQGDVRDHEADWCMESESFGDFGDIEGCLIDRRLYVGKSALALERRVSLKVTVSLTGPHRGSEWVVSALRPPSPVLVAGQALVRKRSNSYLQRVITKLCTGARGCRLSGCNIVAPGFTGMTHIRLASCFPAISRFLFLPNCPMRRMALLMVYQDQ